MRDKEVKKFQTRQKLHITLSFIPSQNLQNPQQKKQIGYFPQLLSSFNDVLDNAPHLGHQIGIELLLRGPRLSH